MDVIDSAGLAFFEDGSLSRSTFGEIASAKGVPFGQAGAVLDARPEGDEIETQLLLLEAQALETGAALGSGFAYPITVDLLKVWVARLDSKGIALAPASHFAKQRMGAGQVRSAALNSAG